MRIPSLAKAPIGLTKSFVIYDESDQQQLVKSAMRRLGHRRQADSRRARVLVPHLVGQEPHARSAGGLSAIGRSQDGEGGHIYEKYRKELRKANALDFDDLLLETVRLLKAVADVRENYNRRYQLHHDRRVSGHQPPAVRD